MNKIIIHGFFDDENILLSAVDEMCNKGINVKEVYTPFPVHGLDKVLKLKETRMAITSFIYGCIGLSFGALMMYYIMIVNWPQNIGGKPNWTFYQNMPAFVPIMFECTVLFAGHLMAITYLFRNKLFPGSSGSSPDIRTTDDKFLVEIETEGSTVEIKKILKKTGAIEINEKQLES